jgi:lipid IVA palmitoyltransferase
MKFAKSLKKLSATLLFMATLGSQPFAHATTGTTQNWFGTAWSHAKKTWNEGSIEVYVPFWSYHLPFAYTPSQREQYTEYPAGIGLGKGRINESGNWEGIYAMGFRDSHNDPSYMVGYGWIPMWNIGKSEIKVGAGLTGFLMSRRDYWNGVPFPGVLPIASLSYKQASLQAAYIPGGQGNGNVIFMWGKFGF